MKTKKYIVSMQCTVFAQIEVDAKDKTDAEAQARKAGSSMWDIQNYTLTPEIVESITLDQFD